MEKSLTLNAEDAKKLRNQAVEATQSHTNSILLLGIVLWNTFRYNTSFNGLEAPLWEAWGHESWFEYVEHELGIHKSTAVAYRRIHEIFNIELESCWDRAVFDQLSATKLRALCKVVNKKNVNGWMRKAVKFSCCQLDEAIVVSQNGGIRADAIHTLSILCTKSEQKKMRDIITQAKDDMKLDRPGKALLRILQEWSVSQAAQEVRNTKKAAG